MNDFNSRIIRTFDADLSMVDIPVLHLDDFLLRQGRGVYVNRLKDHLVQHHNKISVPHRHDFYLTVFFTSGEGIHEIDFVRHVVRPGHCYALNPGQIHHWKLSEDTDGFVFFHSADFSQTASLEGGGFEAENFPFFYSRQNSSEIGLSSEKQTLLKPWFEVLLQESKHNEPRKLSKQHALITLIYIELQRAYDPVGVKVSESGYGSLLKAFESEVDQHFKDIKSPAQYAERLHITPKHLNRVSNEILGKTATQIIADRVILEAKRLLASRKYAVSQVADELGYEDYSYFSRLFKKHQGLSPRQFYEDYVLPKEG
ncbi:MAG: helix-turn-helix domain-containing protein [Roseivirga sp.]|nr:helix-turn-helix domain-containing protein [Roseivirga sp.]